MMRSSRIGLVGLSVCLVACSGPPLSTTVVRAATPITRTACHQCEEAARFVRLQQMSDDSHAASSRQFTHPLVLTPEEWTALLATVQVQRQAEGLLFRDPPGPVLPAFTPEDIRFLCAALSQAFAQAQPHEMVVFGLSHLNSYNMTEFTTGGWFAEGSSLHLVLANYRKVVTMPGTRQLLWERPLRPDAGPRYDLVASQYQTPVGDAGAWAGLFSPSPAEVSISYQAVLVGEPGDPSTPQKELASSPDRDPPTLSLEERLRMLKRWHDQGLITEDEYHVKKQRLLERF
ncbi:MAG: SHOCT domain-containing protein [Nitrospira sp.]